MNHDSHQNIDNNQARSLGMVIAGSITGGLEVRLDSSTAIEEIKVGTFVSISGKQLRFFGTVTDVKLKNTDPNLELTPPNVSNPYVAEVISGTNTYGTITVEPSLTLGDDSFSQLDGPETVKTVPSHFSRVSTASELDIQLVFGKEDQQHFWIGNPMDMEAKLHLNMAEFVKRSNGVFGRSGTGKTFLTRLLLVGILQSQAASNLVFDMHNEYGWKGSSESNQDVKGLKQLFSSKVAVFSLDDQSSKRRGLNPDYVVRIGYEEIEPEDVEALQETLGYSDVAAEAAYNLKEALGSQNWLGKFLALSREDVVELAGKINVHPSSLNSLLNRLSRLKRFDFMDHQRGHDSVGEILQYLNKGMHVVLEFGRYGSDLTAYILVANLLTRRIRDRYEKMTEQALGDQTKSPRPLVITIEEAHKFLNKDVASKTSFGPIAREMRKYNVTLLVVDQRPSGIDEEVMSQLATKVTYALGNDKDIEAVLAGQRGGKNLRSVIASLGSKQQALAFGDALPMPVLFNTREYGSRDSYREFGFKDGDELKIQKEKDVEELFGTQ